jgi:hypothetical protein
MEGVNTLNCKYLLPFQDWMKVDKHFFFLIDGFYIKYNLKSSYKKISTIRTYNKIWCTLHSNTKMWPIALTTHFPQTTNENPLHHA